MLDEKKCWKAVIARDKKQDGQFFFGVRTTGVYCRPSCPSRHPLRKNVRFYATRAEAEHDGLRACLRCRPSAITTEDANRLRIRRLCEYIRLNCESGESLNLDELSAQAGLSPFHLQRTFKAVMGVTPKQYVEACRMEALKSHLREEDSVTNAIYEAGFGSSSRVYERVDGSLGMTPREYRAGGEGVSISYIATATPLGMMMIGATDRGLCYVEFGEAEGDLLAKLRKEFPGATVERATSPYAEQLDLWMKSLGSYLDREQAWREQMGVDLPIDVHGTAFQLKVWKYLRSIPAGEVQRSVLRDRGPEAWLHSPGDERSTTYR